MSRPRRPALANTGTLTINAGDSFKAANLTQISGTTLSAGTYVLAGNLDFDRRCERHDEIRQP